MRQTDFELIDTEKWSSKAAGIYWLVRAFMQGAVSDATYDARMASLCVLNGTRGNTVAFGFGEKGVRAGEKKQAGFPGCAENKLKVAIWEVSVAVWECRWYRKLLVPCWLIENPGVSLWLVGDGMGGLVYKCQWTMARSGGRGGHGTHE